MLSAVDLLKTSIVKLLIFRESAIPSLMHIEQLVKFSNFLVSTNLDNTSVFSLLELAKTD